MPRKFCSIRTEGNPVFRTEGPGCPGPAAGGTHLMVLSEEPLTTRRSRYCRQAMPRLCPFRVRTNSHVLVLHTWGHEANSLRAAANRASAPHEKPQGIHRQRGLRLTEERKPTEHLQRPRAGSGHQWGPSRDRGTGTAVAVRRAGGCMQNIFRWQRLLQMISKPELHFIS